MYWLSWTIIAILFVLVNELTFDRCLLLKVPARTPAGGLQNPTIVGQLAAQIEALKRNIVEVGRLLEIDRAGQEALCSNIENAKAAASILVDSAASLVALSSAKPESDAGTSDVRRSEERATSWSNQKRRSRGSDAASHTSTDSTRQESIFSDSDIPLASPTSDFGSVSPLLPKALENLPIRRESRSSISSASSIFARRELKDDRDQNLALSNLGRFEKSAQIKLSNRNLGGAQQDLKRALECCDRLSPASATVREQEVLRKLIDIADRHIEASRSQQAELLFNIVTDRCILLLPAVGDALRCEIVSKAEKLALGYLEQGDLSEFGMSSSMANGYRDKIIDDDLRARSHDDFALKVAIKASRTAIEMVEEDAQKVSLASKLSRIALHHGARAYSARADVSRAALYEVQIPRQVNQIVEENLKQRKFDEAEALSEQLVEQFIWMSPEIMSKANIRRANLNLAHSCFAQRTEDKLDKAEGLLTRSESWPTDDVDLTHASNFLLAQIYWKKDDLDAAENRCWNAMKGRMDLFGDYNPKYLEVVSLFVRILEKQGQHQESALHATQLNEDFIRKSAVTWCNTHLTYESQNEALQRAVKGGYKEAASVLIQQGAASEELLRRAVFSGDLDAARLLVDTGALSQGNFNHGSRMAEPDHPISLADESGNPEMLKLLLGAAQSIDHCSSIYNLGWAVREQRIATISAFLELGTRPDEVVEGTTYLHLAAEHDWLASLRAMLSIRPNTEIHNSNGDSPLHIAILKGHETIIEALIEGGADIEFRNGPFTPLLLAISEQMFEMVQLLLDLGASPMAAADNGINSLHLAVMGNDVLVVAELLSRFPELINMKTNYGRNALHIAMMECDCDMGRLLVDLGVDVNVRTSMGNSAWDLARRRRVRDKAFETLVQNKMNPKPSKLMAKINAPLVTDPTKASIFGIGIDY